MKVKKKKLFFLPFNVEIKVIILIYISSCNNSHPNPNIVHFGFKRILTVLKHGLKRVYTYIALENFSCIQYDITLRLFENRNLGIG